MNGGFHFGDEINMIGTRNIGKIVGGADPVPAWAASGRPSSKVVWPEPLVFINYRDAEDKTATYLQEEFARRLGSGVAFRATKMPAGVQYRRELLDKASRCSVMIAIISGKWDSPEGLRRLSDPDDWVRREIAAALVAKAEVVPVLVGARPRLVPDHLPEDIREIAGLQGPHLPSGYDGEDVRRLVDRLLHEVPPLAAAAFRYR
jgi:hypothetical protein